MTIHPVMDEGTVYANISSPPSSYHCLYGDHDHYLDASHSSDSHSSATSPYDMTLSRELIGASTSSSSDGRDADGGSETTSNTISPATTATQPSSSKPTTKRKRENRYKNAPPSVLSRRRAQNRASQRAYRERKDQRIKDLEQMLNDAKARNDVLSQAYAELHTEYLKLKAAPPDVLLAGHHHHRQPGTTSSPSVSSKYSTLPRTTTPTVADIAGGTRFMDTSSLNAINAGNDLEAYLYPNVPGYHHL